MNQVTGQDFINAMSAVGAGIAYFVAMSLYIILINIFYYRKLHLEIGTFFKNTHLKIIPPLVVLTLVFFGIKHFFLLNTWLSLIVFEIVYILALGILIFLVLFNNYEKELVLKTIRKGRNGEKS